MMLFISSMQLRKAIIMKIEEVVKKVSHIPSAVYQQEQEMWLKELGNLPGNPVIVDFGTGWGKTAASLALICPQGHVFTFDPGKPYINHITSAEDYEKEVKKYISDAGAKNVTFTRESSLEKEWKQKIDVLSIDSAHSYEVTKGELEKWLPFVKVGGYVFLHDWEHPRCPGIKQAWDELVPEK
ncbi:MAG TPA: hypothetical protein ENI23_11470, partial [bacterium]|nr:hypothetical protein [bacterium]